MIKPEDISDDMTDQVENIIAYHLGKWEIGCDAGGIAAAILNAAIKAGVVSPRIDAEDPRVLRRALRDLAVDLGWLDGGIEKTVSLWIEQARKELESEAGK